MDIAAIQKNWEARQTLQPKPGEEILIPARITHSVRTSPAAGPRWAYGYKV